MMADVTTEDALREAYRQLEEWKRCCYAAEKERDELKKQLKIMTTERDSLYCAVKALAPLIAP